jgi:hypothetical protein
LKIIADYYFNFSFFFDFSASINFKTASKSSAKKFDTSPLGTTKGTNPFLGSAPFFFGMAPYSA